MSAVSPIAVIGAGSWGTALALLLAHNGQQVRLWGRNDNHHLEEMLRDGENRRFLPGYLFPSNLTVTLDLKSAVESVNDILIAVPSHAFQIVLKNLQSLLDKKSRIVWATKGLSQDGQLLSQVAQQILGPDVPIAILSGPSFANEVAQQLPTALCLAGHDHHFIADLQQRFQCPHFRIYPINDLIGVQIGGVVKNILAIATGISDGMQLGANARAALLTRGLKEMRDLCMAMGGNDQTIFGLAGVGDLILTCTDNQSRNRRFGLAIGEGKSIQAARDSINQEVEGYSNTAQVYKLVECYQLECPIIRETYRVLFEHEPPAQALQNLLNRKVIKPDLSKASPSDKI